MRPGGPFCYPSAMRTALAAALALLCAPAEAAPTAETPAPIVAPEISAPAAVSVPLVPASATPLEPAVEAGELAPAAAAALAPAAASAASPAESPSAGSVDADEAADAGWDRLFDRAGPAALLDELKRDPQLAREYAADAGVWQGYTLERHTLMVMTQFERYFARALPTGRRRLMRAVLALHDSGKPAAVRAGDKSRQHEFTLPLVRRHLSRLGFTSADVALGEALVDNDLLGHLIRGKLSLEQARRQTVELSRRAGVSPAEFLSLLEPFYLCDAGSYTVDAGGPPAVDSGKNRTLDALFEFDRAPGAATGTMRLKPEYRARIQPLLDSFL